MTGYFNDDDHLRKLAESAVRWRGTPFRQNTCVAGQDGGVDCVNLLVGVMADCGVDHDFNPPAYTLDWGTHNPESLLLAYLREVEVLEELSRVDAPSPGDILTFKIGLSENHAGIYLAKGIFLHAVRKLGVIEGRLDGGWEERSGAIFRVKRTENS